MKTSALAGIASKARTSQTSFFMAMRILTEAGGDTFSIASKLPSTGREAAAAVSL